MSLANLTSLLNRRMSIEEINYSDRQVVTALTVDGVVNSSDITKSLGNLVHLRIVASGKSGTNPVATITFKGKIASASGYSTALLYKNLTTGSWETSLTITDDGTTDILIESCIFELYRLECSIAGADTPSYVINVYENSCLGFPVATELQSKIAGEDLARKFIRAFAPCTATNITASTTVVTGAGNLAGIIINSGAATATLKVWDNTADAGAVLLGTYTVEASPIFPKFIDCRYLAFATGCRVQIAVAALDVTVLTIGNSY